MSRKAENILENFPIFSMWINLIDAAEEYAVEWKIAIFTQKLSKKGKNACCWLKRKVGRKRVFGFFCLLSKRREQNEGDLKKLVLTVSSFFSNMERERMVLTGPATIKGKSGETNQPHSSFAHFCGGGKHFLTWTWKEMSRSIPIKHDSFFSEWRSKF